MPRTINGVVFNTDRQRTLKYVREIMNNRDAYDEDLKDGFDEAWKEKFKQDWNKVTSTVKEVAQC